MTAINYLLLPLTLLLTGLTDVKTLKESKPIVIVELFTAEGCSSCPKADELLKEMPDLLNKENYNVVGLSFHVTYWNKLGWEDPYSQEIFTERQKHYVTTLNFPQLYTPQAIINGEKEFVGSDFYTFRHGSIEAAENASQYVIEASMKDVDGKTVVSYKVNKAAKNVVLNVAVIEEDIVHFVPRGENKSRTLKHHNVVRSFETLPVKPEEEITVQWPDDLSKDKGGIVLYLQNSKTLKIVGGCML